MSRSLGAAVQYWKIAEGVLRVGITLIITAVSFHVTALADDNTPPTSNGRRLDQWREVMKGLVPDSPEAALEIPGLVELVRNDSIPWFTRRQAALTLGRIGQPAAQVVPILEQYATLPCDNGDASTPLWAVKSLALFGPEAAPATATLARLVHDPQSDQSVRLMSIEALCRIGSAHPLALESIIEYLRAHPPSLVSGQARSANELDRQAACIECLQLFQGEGDSTVPILLRFCEDREDRIRRSVAVTFGTIGPRATEAAERLAIMALADPSLDVRDVAAVSLGKVGGTAWLARLLAQDDDATRERAAAGLRYASMTETAANELLATALTDPAGQVRMTAIESIESRRSSPAVTAPAAAKELISDDRQVRVRAARFLNKLGSKAKPATSQLKELSNGTDQQARQAATRLLEMLSVPNQSTFRE